MKLPLGGAEAVVGLAELGKFHVLIGEGLGGADAGEGGLNLGGDDGHLGLDLPGDFAELAPPGHDHQDKERNQQTYHQRQTPFDGEHDDEGADNGGAGDEEILRAVVCQLRDLE